MVIYAKFFLEYKKLEWLPIAYLAPKFNEYFWTVMIILFIISNDVQPIFWVVTALYYVKKFLHYILDLQFLADFCAYSDYKVLYKKGNVARISSPSGTVYIFFRSSTSKVIQYKNLFDFEESRVLVDGISYPNLNCVGLVRSTIFVVFLKSK